MDRYRREYLTMSQHDFERAHDILDRYYNRGDIENISVENNVRDFTVTIGLECSTDDLLALKEEFKENGIIVE